MVQLERAPIAHRRLEPLFDDDAVAIGDDGKQLDLRALEATPPTVPVRYVKMASRPVKPAGCPRATDVAFDWGWFHSTSGAK
jgi:hypothetical protein